MDTEYGYSVYSITDGAIGDTDFVVESFEEAQSLFDAAVGYEIVLRRNDPDNYTETTVYLYDSFMGNMIMEEVITG